jgi:putative ABC transport system permease protein
VLGGFAARALGLKVGDTFHPFHGLAYDPEERHPETYVVTGVMALSNTPADKVVWIPLHGLQTLSGHDAKAEDEVSAVLVQLRAPSAGFMLDQLYNKQGDRLTFAYPIGAIVADLFEKISWFDRVLALVAYLVAVLAAAGVLVAIYNSMSARQRDIAILRSLGARRRAIFGVIVMEAAVIGALGMAAAFGVHAVLAMVVAGIIQSQTGVMLAVFAYDPVMVWAPAGMIGMCAIGGLLPAWKAYRTDVAANLAPVS